MDISFQLYSARNFLPWDDVVKMLAALGCTRVEGFNGVYSDPQAFRALLDENGLSMPSGHFYPIGGLEDDFAASLAAARSLGMSRIFCPAPEEPWRSSADADSWIDLARRLEKVGKEVSDAGLRFGWHNHHWEFIPLSDGRVAMDLILEHAPSIEWEMDVAWVVRAGADPLEWIAKHGERITAAHVKDIAGTGQNADEDGWADVGYGTINWKQLMDALRGIEVDLFVLEHDNPSDARRFASRSVETFRSL